MSHPFLKGRRGRRLARNSSAHSSPALNRSGGIARRGKSLGGNSSNGIVKEPDLPPIADPDRDIYVVESLLKCRDAQSEQDERHFFVKWLNYPSSQNSWEPESNLSRDLVVKWDRRYLIDDSRKPSTITIRRPSSKLSSGLNDSADSPKMSKGKKRILSKSPRTTQQDGEKHIVSPTMPTPVAESSATKKKEKEKSPVKSRSEQPRQPKKPSPQASKLYSVVGPISAERVLSVYRECEGDLCYLIDRSFDVSEPPIPANGPSSPIQSGGSGDHDRKQIVSSQVFDVLFPNIALEFYEKLLQSTGCLETLDVVNSGSLLKKSKRNLQQTEDDEQKRKKNDSDDEDESDEEEEEEYEVEKVVDVMYRGNKRFYLLKWVGYPGSENTWEPEDNVHCFDLMDAFWASRDEADPRKKKKLTTNAAVLPRARTIDRLICFFLDGSTPSEGDKTDLWSSKDKWRFLVKWHAETKPTAVDYWEVRDKWPLLVLRFFQKYLEG